MTQPQEIIVYRNSYEKALYDSLSEYNTFPVIAGLIVAFAAGMVSSHLLDGVFSRVFGRNKAEYVHLAIGITAGAITTYVLS